MFSAINVHSIGDYYNMAAALEMIISSRALKLFGLKPFGNTSSKSCRKGGGDPANPTENQTAENHPLREPDVPNNSLTQELKTSSNDLKWKYFAVVLDRMFFFIHATVLVTVLLSYQRAFS